MYILIKVVQKLAFLCYKIYLLWHVGVLSDFVVGQDVGSLLWHQDPDQVDGAADLHVGHVQTFGQRDATHVIVRHHGLRGREKMLMVKIKRNEV